jgi:imidazoleglycerol phosphate dehydratase HisB
MKRQAEIVRKTKETDIRVALTLDGKGSSRVNSGVPFWITCSICSRNTGSLI